MIGACGAGEDAVPAALTLGMMRLLSRGLSRCHCVSPQEDRGLPAPAGGLPGQAVLPGQAQAVFHQQGNPQLGPHPPGQGPQEPAEAGEQ